MTTNDFFPQSLPFQQSTSPSPYSSSSSVTTASSLTPISFSVASQTQYTNPVPEKNDNIMVDKSGFEEMELARSADSERTASQMNSQGSTKSSPPNIELNYDLDSQLPLAQQPKKRLSKVFNNPQPRKRTTRACDQCNHLRTKCDGKSPCAHCVGMSLISLDLLYITNFLRGKTRVRI